jgi:hypothetical protein
VTAAALPAQGCPAAGQRTDPQAIDGSTEA